MGTISKIQSPKELINDYQKNGEVISWPVEPELQDRNDIPAFKHRNQLGEKMAMWDVADILKMYLRITLSDMDELVDLLSRHVLPEPLHGIGIEMGAGTGFLASKICEKSPSVKAIMAVELTDKMTELIIPKVAASILGRDAAKIVPVIGSFNRLPLENNSVDFIVELGSFHHSDDLKKTFQASYRVLKPGGLLMCLERCHPDTLTDAEIEEKLSRVYSKQFLVTHGYPTDITLTRAENGEHEYRFSEWKRDFESAGFVLGKVVEFVAVDYRRLIKDALSILPQALLPRRLRKPKYNRITDEKRLSTIILWLRHHLNLSGNRSRLYPKFIAPKNYTVFLLKKPFS